VPHSSLFFSFRLKFPRCGDYVPYVVLSCALSVSPFFGQCVQGGRYQGQLHVEGLGPSLCRGKPASCRGRSTLCTSSRTATHVVSLASTVTRNEIGKRIPSHGDGSSPLPADRHGWVTLDPSLPPQCDISASSCVSSQHRWMSDQQTSTMSNTYPGLPPVVQPPMFLSSTCHPVHSHIFTEGRPLRVGRWGITPLKKTRRNQGLASR